LARKKGIIPSEQSQPAPDKVYELLFASGFSTKSEVSDISGRGVGLDAVRSTLRERGGDVWIESEKGKGTCFHIVLPSQMVFVAHNGESLLAVSEKPALEKAS
jgi:two-component system chemotaxis sensor kinase CheA